MENNKKDKIILILFLTFWVFSLISIILNFSVSLILLSLLIYLPITLLIIIKKHPLALLILLLLCSFELLINLIGFAGMILNNDYDVINIISIVINVLFYIALFNDAFKLLRNKEKVNKTYLYVLCLLVSIITLITFIRDMVFVHYESIKILISNIALSIENLTLPILFVFYLNETEFGELEIFH